MRVLIDTSIWSLVLRRSQPVTPHAEELAKLLRSGTAVLLGAVRQEVLSGIPDPKTLARLRSALRTVPDHRVSTAHHETAAEFFNVCRGQGIQGSMTDFLLCAVSAIDRIPIYTSDADFGLFGRHLPIMLYR